MNAANYLTSSPFATALGWTLIHFIWQGALVAGGLLVLRPWWRHSSQSRYNAYVLALALMSLLPLATGLFCYAAAIQPIAVEPLAGAWTLKAENGGGNGLAAVLPELTSVAIAPNHLPYLLLAWGLGVGLLSLRLAGGWAYCQYLKRRAAHWVAPHWQQRAERLAVRTGLKRSVRLFVSARVAVPMTIGWLRPVILLPVGLFERMPLPQIEAVLLHELAHIRRCDYLVNMLQSLVETLFFYHPAVWWLSAHIRQEREYCCDDQTVALGGDRLVYAKALTSLATGPQPRWALSAKGGVLLQRLTRLVDPEARRPDSLGRSDLLAGLLLAGLLALCGGLLPGASQAQGEDPLPLAPMADGQLLPASQSLLDVKLWVDEDGRFTARTRDYIDSTGHFHAGHTTTAELIQLGLLLKALRTELEQTERISISFHPDADRALVGEVAKIAQEVGLVHQQITFMPKTQLLENEKPYTLAVEVTVKSRLKAVVFDVGGQAICTLEDDEIEPGTHTIVWGGQDDQGNQVENGIYFCRVQLGAGNKMYKIVKR
ncbi:MAG: M48 family metalloprotease [Candidatus Latescibacteria bacterium]|nr:M48 family metalloprotease [Candidatus Latescibacterota bacterium]